MDEIARLLDGKTRETLLRKKLRLAGSAVGNPACPSRPCLNFPDAALVQHQKYLTQATQSHIYAMALFLAMDIRYGFGSFNFLNARGYGFDRKLIARAFLWRKKPGKPAKGAVVIPLIGHHFAFDCNFRLGRHQ